MTAMYAHKSASCKVQFAAKKQAGQFFVGEEGRKEESICSSKVARSSTRIRQMADGDKKQNSGGNKQEGGKADRDGTSPKYSSPTLAFKLGPRFCSWLAYYLI